MNWTEQEYADHLRKRGIVRPEPSTASKTKRRGVMNKLEARYEDECILSDVLMGIVKAYEFEAVKLRLADGAWYTPDFLLDHVKGLTLVEVKGFWREAARIRIKVAADKYPMFRFFAVTCDRKTGEWKYEGFAARRIA